MMSRSRSQGTEVTTVTGAFCFEREKKAYIAGLGRDQLEHLASPMTKFETSPSPNTNESKTSPRR